MKTISEPGLVLLTEVMCRLEAITPEQFQAPQAPCPRRAYVIGEATDYQKALVTLRDQIIDEHEQLHLAEGLRFGGHINLPPEHEFLHAAPETLEILLTVSLSNSFKELSAYVDYFITSEWKVCVIRQRRMRRPFRRRY